ncbi:uncharacterized protein LOC142230973 [Haematobia irritans]|uniref:uncharacterized protein LOC142230973 n=1 Tax=Haematobia irritans TaxID=7368 RepID=UPI003F4FBC2E
MKFFKLLLCVAFVVGISAVSGKTASGDDQDAKTSASVPVVKPTAAPLMTSTQAPTKAAVTPTKVPPTKASGRSNNAAKKTSPKAVAANSDKKTEVKPTEKTSKPVEKEPMEAKPIEIPATVETSNKMKVQDSKPLAVTGFITQNGNIYEIEDKAGMGKIEGRQNTADENQEHICNYGSVVIYSDVPCDEVTNIEISPVNKPAEAASKPEVSKPQEQNSVQSTENKDKEDTNVGDSSEVKPVTHRPNSKKPRNKNRRRRNRVRQQQKNRRNNRRGGNRRRQGQNQRRSQQEMTQRRRRQQQRRRQNNFGFRRQGQNQWHRNRRGNRRRQPAYFNDFEEDDYNRGRSL